MVASGATAALGAVGGLGGNFLAGGRTARNGFGAWLDEATVIPRAVAICGSNAPRRSTVLAKSGVMVSGFEVTVIWVRIGAKAAASRTAIQRSANASATRLCDVASVSRRPSSSGKIAPAFGGCPANLSARTMRPTPSAALMSSSQFWYS